MRLFLFIHPTVMLAFLKHQNNSDLCSIYDSLKPRDELLKKWLPSWGFSFGLVWVSPHPVSV